MRCARKFEKFDTFFEVALVGFLVVRDGLVDLVLLLTPLSRPLVEELLRDPAVELVDVHLVDPVLEALVVLVEALNRLVMELLLIDVALSEGL